MVMQGLGCSYAFPVRLPVLGGPMTTGARGPGRQSKNSSPAGKERIRIEARLAESLAARAASRPGTRLLTGLTGPV